MKVKFDSKKREILKLKEEGFMKKGLIFTVTVVLMILGAFSVTFANDKSNLLNNVTTVVQEHPYSLIFEQAAQEFEVPSSLLKSLGWAESHWSMRNGEPSIDQAYGIMGLKSQGDFNSLAEAAKLIGVPTEQLKIDPSANIRGASAYLRKIAEQLKLQGYVIDNRPETWEQVLILYSGIKNNSTALDYTYLVYYYLNL